MATINPNDSAFAKSAFYHTDYGIDSPQEGLTKREYFAAIALQGLLAGDTTPGVWIVKDTNITSTAVEFADKLIEELNKTKQP
jgi:hypothetical protein